MLVSLAPGRKTIGWNSIEALFTNVFNTTGKHVLNTAEVEYYGALLLAGEIKNRTSGKGYQLSPNEMLAFCGLASNDEGSSTSDTTLPDTSTADKDQGIPGTYKRPLEDAQREQDSVITKKTKGDSHLADRYLADQRSDASM